MLSCERGIGWKKSKKYSACYKSRALQPFEAMSQCTVTYVGCGFIIRSRMIKGGGQTLSADKEEDGREVNQENNFTLLSVVRIVSCGITEQLAYSRLL